MSVMLLPCAMYPLTPSGKHLLGSVLFLSMWNVILYILDTFPVFIYLNTCYFIIYVLSDGDRISSFMYSFKLQVYF